MKKIPTVFERDETDRSRVTERFVTGLDWVLDGMAVPTRKWDGTCVLLDADGEWWVRREVRPGKGPPPNFRPTETDPATGKTVGWEPAHQSGFAKYLDEAARRGEFDAGTYELCGPKINGNPEGLAEHQLLAHGSEVVELPTDFWLRPEIFLGECGYEGIVWHNTRTGAMAKLKARDYGISR